MKYLGGKHKIAKSLLEAMTPYLERHSRLVWEPFCGGLNFSRMLTKCSGVLSDSHPALIALFRAYRAGWRPPTDVSASDYERAKTLPDSDPLKAFIGFGCSFAGKYFKGYAPNTTRIAEHRVKGKIQVTERPAKSLACLNNLTGFDIECADFLDIVPEPLDAVLYCDPPYANTTQYGLAFDTDRFWLRASQWAQHSTVLVSEYGCPIAHTVVWSQARSRPMSRLSAGVAQSECLFLVHGCKT